MPSAAPTSKATSTKGRFSHLYLLLSRAGESRTGGSPARLLRAVVDARLAERERMLRRQIADTRRVMREIAG